MTFPFSNTDKLEHFENNAFYPYSTPVRYLQAPSWLNMLIRLSTLIKRGTKWWVGRLSEFWEFETRQAEARFEPRFSKFKADIITAWPRSQGKGRELLIGSWSTVRQIRFVRKVLSGSHKIFDSNLVLVLEEQQKTWLTWDDDDDVDLQVWMKCLISLQKGHFLKGMRKFSRLLLPSMRRNVFQIQRWPCRSEIRLLLINELQTWESHLLFL